MADSPTQIEILKQTLNVEIDQDQYKINNNNELVYLNLTDHSLIDISFIQSFSSLEYLDLTANQITNITPLSKLDNLKHLYLGDNKIREIYPINELKQLIELDISYNPINNLEPIKNLIKLKSLNLTSISLNNLYQIKEFSNIEYLDLSETKIHSITGISNLKNITHLIIDYNEISDISELRKLTKIKVLSATENQIKDITPITHLPYISKLDISDNKVSFFPLFDVTTTLKSLDIFKNQISNITSIQKFKNLISLSIGNNPITNIKGIKALKKLESLDLDGIATNDLSSISALSKLKRLFINNIDINELKFLENHSNLTSLFLTNCNLSSIHFNNFNIPKTIKNLNLSFNGIENLSFLDKIYSLSSLTLKDNRIKNISNLNRHKTIRYLNLEDNLIDDIESLDQLHDLRSLDLGDNFIYDISPLFNLKKLLFLNLKENSIDSIADIPIKFLKQLIELKLENNPVNIPLSNFNDLQALIGYLESQHDPELLVNNEHVKINIIGDGRIGKSQLFNVLQGQKFQYNQKETHGTNTGKYVIQRDKVQYTATLWDFGGQSYHHGTHTIFLRPNDMYLTLWKTSTTNNYGYWLGTARTFGSDTAPLFLVQNVWTSDNERSIYPDSQKIDNYKVKFDHIFSFDISQFKKRKTSFIGQIRNFKDSLNQEIIKHAQSFGKLPRKIVNIKNELDTHPITIETKQLTKEEFKSKYASNFEAPEFSLLLNYLAFAGNILYFDEVRALEPFIFPNPPALSNWIYHEILDDEFKRQNSGRITKESIIESHDIEAANVFFQLMTQFQLIFENKLNTEATEYIIPQFLPENNSSLKRILLDLIPYTFCIHFSDFIHEGRIFQFISRYGRYALDDTSYWKYGLLFEYPKEKLQVLVYYNIEERKIFAHIEEGPKKNTIAQEIFDFFLLNEVKPIDNKPKKIDKHNQSNIEEEQVIEETKDLKRSVTIENIPFGTLLSTNKQHFVDIKETIENIKNKAYFGICKTTLKRKKLNNMDLNLLSEEKLPKKVFISYSRKDVDYKDELRTHLALLNKYDVIRDWACEDIQPGEWNPQIQTELEKADIIVYMISANFLSSEYIMDKEVKKGIELVEQNKNKHLICVLVKSCQWQNWSLLDSKFGSEKTENMDLSRYQFLPYHKDNGEEKILALEQWGRKDYEPISVAYTAIVNQITRLAMN